METMMTQPKTSETKLSRRGSRTPANVPTPAKRARRTIPIAANRAARTAVDADGTIAALERLQENLHATREKLQLVQADRLSDDEFKAFARQSHQVNLAISATRNALLGAISAQFAAELPAINEATGRLKLDLQRLQDSVEIIRAVASTLGIIENVVKLLA
jgi:hypothetical protein